MKRFYCVILAMLAVILYAIVMSGCRAISSNVEVATQPVVETPLAEHIGKMRQGSFINDAEEFVRNISVLLEEKSPHDYSVRRIEEILLNNEYLEEYFKGNTEPLALYCFEYIINHESLCYVSDNQNVSFSGNDKAIALIAWELMLTYDDTDLNYIAELAWINMNSPKPAYTELLLTQNRHPKTMLQTAISSIFVYINFWRSFRYGKKTFGSCFASHCVDFWFNSLRMSFL